MEGGPPPTSTSQYPSATVRGVKSEGFEGESASSAYPLLPLLVSRRTVAAVAVAARVSSPSPCRFFSLFPGITLAPYL
ncbi:hypothetical protein ZWY2020_043120 [Hordeum vulgare]|nr:hypothetical protein ZWY2020_043120 [Hordeum vulgare]